MLPLGLSDPIQVYLADTAALAAVAIIGYLFGQRSRQSPGKIDEKLYTEVSRASLVAKELQEITQRIRQDVAFHQANISQFKSRLTRLQNVHDGDGWIALSSEAESLLVPTMKLATDLSLAYDELRKQSALLMNFAGSRTDPKTGLNNRRAMEEQLEILLSLHEQNQSRFSVTLFSVDCSPEEKDHQQAYCEFATLLQSCARDTDVVARYSNEEFVVVIPQTSLAGATIFSERLLQRTNSELHCVVTGGIVEVQRKDDTESLLSRADSALYSARSHGYSCLYQHNGKSIRPHETELGQSENDLATEAVAQLTDDSQDAKDPLCPASQVDC